MQKISGLRNKFLKGGILYQEDIARPSRFNVEPVCNVCDVTGNRMKVYSYADLCD